MDANVADRNWGWSISSSGPMVTPFNTRADIMMAAAFPPGIPKDSSGTMAPPVAALLPVSGAAMPSRQPVPNFSGCLESFCSME